MGTAHLLKLLSLFTGISVLQQVRSWSITLPKTVTAVEGSCVVVSCHTQPHSRVIWYQYHNIHYPVVFDELHPHTTVQQFKERTSVLGKAAEGNCTLRINDVTRADNHVQIYVWINPDSKTTQKFHDQTVTILVDKKAPTISIQKQMVDGELFQAICSVYFSCPFSPPLIHWSSFLENSNVTNKMEKVQGQWLYTVTLQGQATYTMHNSKINCCAEFRTFHTESQQIILSILYKPVTVTLMTEKEPVMEGGSVIMECAANCNPEPHMYSWLKRQMGQITNINSTQRKMPLSNITRDTSFSCIAHNDIGAGQSDWLDLDVQYIPVILPESSCNLTGEVLKCVCQAEAFPNASLYWTIDGNDTLPSSFSFFSTNKKNVVSGVVSGSATSQSNISCTATNSLGSNTKQLSIENLSKTSSSFMWLIPLILLDIALLFGCAVLIYRKYYRNRRTPGFTCSVMISRPQSVQQEYHIPQRSQDENTQSRPCRPESDPEVDCVYNNDIVVKMQQQHQNKATACRRGGLTQPLAKGVHCNMSDYLNC